ncbi:MAG: NAD-dependent epimerase/dehydratase family protein [Candidatus Electrothrix sp. AR3]|nr:NAD-dependent epimerase/dehydratase family protein [Candidatus Electrothrix sp. AR3]
MKSALHAVTGAFGYSGKCIAKRLLDQGQRVITITNSYERKNPFGEQIRAFPFYFDEQEKLEEALEGVSVLYNTYWVRFNHKTFTHADAVRNTETLFRAAKKAGVKRIVHVSITNPSIDSPLEYFSGKARLENALIESGISHAILRPAVLFGKDDMMINNIFWVVRHLPISIIFGNGEYKLQPIYVDDLAALAVEQGKERENSIIDAIGPETFTYRELIKTIGDIIGKHQPVVSVSPKVGYVIGLILGKFLNDVLITKEEIEGLMDNLLYVDSPPAGNTKLTEWAKKHSETLGLKYSNELARRLDRETEYSTS